MAHQTTKEDVATLLENFSDYINPSGEEDPWFTLDEINRQFAWEDIPNDTLTGWLEEMIKDGQVATEDQDDEDVYRWLS